MSEKTYTLSSTAWPRTLWAGNEKDNIVDQLLIEQEGESSFQISWYRLHDCVVPRIESFQDSWFGMAGVVQLLSRYAQEVEDLTPDEVIAKLEQNGFVAGEYHGKRAARSPYPADEQ